MDEAKTAPDANGAVPVAKAVAAAHTQDWLRLSRRVPNRLICRVRRLSLSRCNMSKVWDHRSALSKIDITTVQDLLRHYPRRHLDFQNREHIRDLVVGSEVSIFGTIRLCQCVSAKKGNMSILSAIISDGTGSVIVTRFVGGKSNKYLLDRYKAQW